MFRHTFRISVSVQHILVVPSSNQRLPSAKVKALLLQRCALRKFHVTDGQNTRDQITSDRKSKRAWSRRCAHYDCDALWIQNFQDGGEGREISQVICFISQ